MKRVHLAVGAGVVLLAFVAGWMRPIEPTAGDRVQPAPAWRLPDPDDLERSGARQLAAIERIRWLGDDGTATAPQRVEWRLIGVVGPETDRIALVSSGKPPLIKQFQTGDTLPDGSILASVGSGGVIVELDGCRMHRPIYPAARNTRANARGDCDPAGSQ